MDHAIGSPFPGMDPYLEHPALWPDVHNSLIAAIRDALVPLVAPKYFVGLERRTYLLKPDDVVLIGRPDIAVVERQPASPVLAPVAAGVAFLDVEAPLNDEVGETFLEVHEVETGRLVTLIELLSPVNKLHQQGRRDYEDKRAQVFRSRTNLVEIDLLHAGEPMPVVGREVQRDYRILISRGRDLPRAQLLAFNLRQPIPSFSLPLLPGDDEPLVELNTILHELYRRARFDLRLDYSRPPVPAPREDDMEWAELLIAQAQ